MSESDDDKPVAKCGHEDATLAPCPYDQEILGDDRPCLCCAYCRECCARDV
jgi:hypothetical protein